MGWDYIDYRDRNVHLHDLQLWALRHFLADAAGSLAAEEPQSVAYEEARGFFMSWDWPGPGVMTGTSLDNFAQGNHDRERVLVRICDRATDRLQAFGEVVPLEYLVAYINANSPGGVYTSPQPSHAFVQGIEQIRGLLAPDATL
jgi:hypothetical protein